MISSFHSLSVAWLFLLTVAIICQLPLVAVFSGFCSSFILFSFLYFFRHALSNIELDRVLKSTESAKPEAQLTNFYNVLNELTCKFNALPKVNLSSADWLRSLLNFFVSGVCLQG